MAAPCSHCNGEGYTGSDDERTPWSFWEGLPRDSDLAVRMGIITKIECESCGGTGEDTITVEPEPDEFDAAAEMSADEARYERRYGE